jgi:hypothetical protein
LSHLASVFGLLGGPVLLGSSLLATLTGSGLLLAADGDDGESCKAGKSEERKTFGQFGIGIRIRIRIKDYIKLSWLKVLFGLRLRI